MKEDRRGVALAIKSCLDSLKDDACKSELDDLARFISLAAMAAEEAALAHDSKALGFDRYYAGGAGHCWTAIASGRTITMEMARRHTEDMTKPRIGRGRDALGGGTSCLATS